MLIWMFSSILVPLLLSIPVLDIKYKDWDGIITTGIIVLGLIGKQYSENISSLLNISQEILSKQDLLNFDPLDISELLR